MAPTPVRQWMVRVRRESRRDSDCPDAAVLLVHGMGAQQSRETLFEWADPLLRRLEYRLAPREQAADVDAAAPLRMLDYATSADGEAAMLAEVSRGRGHPPFRILLREARWSESFLPLSRREVFSWATRFLWKALRRTLVYISGVVATRLTQPEGTPRAVRLIVRMLVAVGWIAIIPALWLVSAALAVVLTLALTFSSVLLLVPIIRDAAATTLLALVEAIGDPAVLVSRPARAGAMRHHVADSLRALRADAGPTTPVTVIAHSQGAAIATEVLFAVGGETNAVGLLPMSSSRTSRDPQPISTLVTVGAGVSLLGSGYTHGGPLRGRPIEAWRRSRMADRWINIWATWDPISAGAIADDDAARTTATRRARVQATTIRVGSEHGIDERQVRTTANPLTDHQSYPTNVPEVIDPIIDAVLESAGVTVDVDAREHDATLRWARLVRLHGLNRIVIAATGLAVAFTSAIASSSFVARIIDVVSTYVIDLRELLSGPLLSWLAPWLSNAVVLVIVTIALLWFSSRLRSAVERRDVWQISARWTRWLAALHLPFTIAIGVASSITAAFAVHPLLTQAAPAPTLAVGLGVLLVWSASFALAFDVPRVRAAPTNPSALER